MGARAALLVLTIVTGRCVPLHAQTLARPGWRGSGLHAERWWRDAVLLEAAPDRPVDAAQQTALQRLRGRLDDVQALGCDAILLRDTSAPNGRGAGAAGGLDPLNPAWGSVDQFDALLADAGRHRLRLLVELRALPGDTVSLASTARFWLSRGVAGLYVSGEPGGAAARMLRPVLHQFVGERVLLGDGDLPPSHADEVNAQAEGPRQHRTKAGAAGPAASPASSNGLRSGPDLVLLSLDGLAAAGEGRGASLAGVQRAFGGAPGQTAGLHRAGAAGTAVWRLADDERPANPAQAQAWLSVLLSAQGGVALRATDLPDASPPATHTASAGAEEAAQEVASAPPPSTGVAMEEAAPLRWTERMLALHRGNTTLRNGTATVLNHDAQGVLVVLWRAPRGPALVEAINLRNGPVTFSVADDLQRLHARGAFLRTVLRSDNGMGAMPLSAVALQPYGIYLGQLSR